MRMSRAWQKSRTGKAVWKSNALCELTPKHGAFPQGDSMLEAHISGEARNGLHVREKERVKVEEG